MRSTVIALALVASLAACSPPAAKPADAPKPEAAAAQAPASAATPVVSDAWATPSMGGAKMAAGYLKITNPGGLPDRLLSAASPRAGSVMIHEMKMDGAMMSMAPVQGGVEIPAGGSVELAPGGYHMMLEGLTAPLKIGETVPVTLTFEKAGEVKAELSVRSPMAPH